MELKKVQVNVEKPEESQSKEEDTENDRDVILDDMYYPLDYDEEAEIEYNNKVKRGWFYFI